MTAVMRVGESLEGCEIPKYRDRSLGAGRGPVLTALGRQHCDSGGKTPNHASVSAWISPLPAQPEASGGGWGWGLQVPPFLRGDWAQAEAGREGVACDALQLEGGTMPLAALCPVVWGFPQGLPGGSVPPSWMVFPGKPTRRLRNYTRA